MEKNQYELFSRLSEKGVIEYGRAAVAVAQDDAVLEAVQGAREQKIAEFTLLGDIDKIKAIAERLGVNLDDVQLIHEPDDRKAA